MEILNFRNCKIIFGRGALAELKKEILSLNAKKIFLITGKKSAQASGLADKIKKLLAGFDVVLFNDFNGYPTISDTEACRDAFKKSGANIIIGLGGGSAMDMAKTVSVLGKAEGSIAYLLEKEKFSKEKIPCITIPTIAGTGAEITPFSVIYSENKKYSLDNMIVQPEVSIIDPELSVSAPAEASYFAALDCFSQAVEALWAVKSTEESDGYAAEALEILKDAIKNIFSAPEDFGLRSDLAKASFYSGMAISITRTTAPHALSYPLTINFGVPHGAAVAALLPAILDYNYAISESDCQDARGSEFVKKKIERAAEIVTGTKNIKSFQKAIFDFNSKIDLGQYGVSGADLGKLMESINEKRLSNNPRSFNREEIKKIYKTIL